MSAAPPGLLEQVAMAASLFESDGSSLHVDPVDQPPVEADQAAPASMCSCRWVVQVTDRQGQLLLQIMNDRFEWGGVLPGCDLRLEIRRELKCSLNLQQI